MRHPAAGRRRIRRLGFSGTVLSLVVIGAFGSGCDRSRGPTDGGGRKTGISSAEISKAIPLEAAIGAAHQKEFEAADIAVLQTDLSPTMVLHSRTPRLDCFTGLASHGLGAPAYAAFGADGGPRIVTNGQPADVRRMNECWVLVWFAGARGWTNGDFPWAIFLQHPPASLQLDDDGLHLEFAHAAGTFALMPLYGHAPLPAPGQAPLPKTPKPRRSKDKNRPLQSWEWSKVLPREVLMRIRYWAGATRRIPISCDDTWREDSPRASVIFSRRCEWLSLADHWRTRPLKLTPIHPSLAAAARDHLGDNQFFIQFSHPVFDLELPTPTGPYLGAHDVDGFDAIVRRGVSGLEASVLALTNALATSTNPTRRDITHENPARSWPELRLGPDTSSSSQSHRSFGFVRPGTTDAPRVVQEASLNRQTRVTFHRRGE